MAYLRQERAKVTLSVMPGHLWPQFHCRHFLNSLSCINPPSFLFITVARGIHPVAQASLRLINSYIAWAALKLTCPFESPGITSVSHGAWFHHFLLHGTEQVFSHGFWSLFCAVSLSLSHVCMVCVYACSCICTPVCEGMQCMCRGQRSKWRISFNLSPLSLQARVCP